MVHSTLSVIELDNASFALPSQENSSMFDTSSNDGYSRDCQNAEFATTPNVRIQTTSLEDGYWLRSLPSGPPPPQEFWLLLRLWRMLRLRDLHVRLLCRHFLRSSIWRACLLVSKCLLRLWGQVLQVVDSLRAESSIELIWYMSALCLTMWHLYTPDKIWPSWRELNCTRFYSA